MNQGFFSKLFDLSFESFITTSIIKVLYVLTLIVSGLVTLLVFITLASSGTGGAVAGLVIAPLIFLLYAIFARVYMEILIVVFRIAEDVATVAAGMGSRAPQSQHEPGGSSPSIGEQLRELSSLRNDELITQEEFDQRHEQLIARL